MRAIEKYLANYAEPETSSARQLFSRERIRFEHVLVIPAYDEDERFISRIEASPLAEQCLLILVINQPENIESPINQSLYDKLAGSSSFSGSALSLVQQNELNILLVDRFSPTRRIPEKQGVGLARKIGADIACALQFDGIIRSPWIYSSDADAHLPENYFSPNGIDPNVHSARVFNFSHINDNSPTAEATVAYESALKYYRHGLAWAQSPYAFYTLGSTLAVNGLHYAQARGFPKKAGGEDFYLLNKLAKLGSVNFDENIHISIEARLSQRVPFGTGPAVTNILQRKAQDQEYCYYNPEIFSALKTWLQWAKVSLPQQMLETPNVDLGDLPDFLQDAATSLSFNQFIQHAIKQCKTQDAVIQHFHHWFDAFRTLKFIHRLQEQYFSPTPIDVCIQARENWL